MATALRPLQTSVYQKLTASSALMSKVSGVYDEVPEAVSYPYVSLGSVTEIPDDAHDRQGFDSLVVVHVWSKYQGNAEVADIFAAVDAALDRQPLTVSGWTDVSIRLDQSQVMQDPDPLIRHLNAQYRVRMTRSS